MAESNDTAPRPTDPVGRALYPIARILAIVGGLVLSLLAAITTISIIGRAIPGIGPIYGDFEIVAIGTGIAVFCFLPWCQLNRGNVVVDFFMTRASTRAKTFFDTLGATFYLVIATLLTWRMIYGGIEMYETAEKSLTLNFPRWSTFPLSVVLMGFLVIVVAYTVGRSAAETRAGRYFNEQSMY
jgi:TRAP-type C4-dicarboxylate transport system permease small subunit